jgi:hypothetical protein
VACLWWREITPSVPPPDQEVTVATSL